MHARVFSRIKHSSKRFAQIALFSSLTVILTLSFHTTSFGQSLPSSCNVSTSDPLYYFKTLFCPEDTVNGVDPTKPEYGIINPKTPAFSGIKDRDGAVSISPVLNSSTDPGGVTGINIGAWIVMDPKKNTFGWWLPKTDPAPTGFFWDYTANSGDEKGNDVFVLRVKYKKADGKEEYLYQGITQQKLEKDIKKRGTENIEIGFFREYTDDGLKQTIISHQQARSYITFPNIQKYGSSIEADLWYCGGAADNNAKISNEFWSLSNNATDANWPSRDYDVGRKKTTGALQRAFSRTGSFSENAGALTDPGFSKTNMLWITDDPSTPSVDPKCGGTSYYKIGDTVSYQLPPTFTQYQQDELVKLDASVQGTASQSASGGLPECGIIGTGSVLGCVAQIIYGLIYKPISFIAALFGYLFDFFIGYSVSDESYRFAFVNTGWQLVRDICNIFFIIILVWTGFATVFNIGGVSMKKVIPTLLINALAINFSLFGTRVIIDLSNVVARVFYNQLGVCTTKDCSPDLSTGKVEYKRGIGGYWPLSEKIVASFNPQTILSSSLLSSTPGVLGATNNPATFNTQTSTQNGVIDTGGLESGNGMAQTSSEYATYFIIVTLIGAAIMVAVAMMFWGVAFMFLGRVIGLYVTMIFSPLAVLTRGNLPLIGKIPKLSWSDWSKDLTSYAMLAPIFIFFLYIIYAFLQTDFMEAFGVTKGNRSFFENVLYIAIPMLIIYQLIKTGVGLAKQYAGSMGNMVQDGINGAVGGFGGVLGGGIGLAAGAVALAGRGGASIVGKVLNKTGATDAIAARAENNWGYRKLNQGIKWSQTSSMDVRDTKLNQKVGQGLGLLGAKPIDNISQKVGFGTFNLGQGTYKGGVQKIQKDRIEAEGKAIDKKLDFSHLSETQATDAWKRHTNKKVDQAWEKQTVENEVKNNTQLVTLKETETQIKSIMEQAAAAGDFKAVASQKAKLNDNKREQAVLLSGIEKAVKAKKKDGAHKDSDEYKKIEKEVLEQIKQEHGKVEDAKQFSEAMRAEYIKRQLEESLFLSGEVSEDVRGTGTIGGLTGILASGSMSSIGGGTALLANYIDSRQADKKAALQGKLEKYNKGKKEGAAKAATAARKKAQHDKDLQDAEATLRQAIAEKEQKNIEDITSLDDYSYEVQKDAIQQMTAKLNREKDESKETYEVALRNLKSAKNKTTVGGFAGGGGSTSPEEIAKLQKAVDDAAVIQQKAFDRHKDASEALKKREKATDNLYSLNKDSDAAKRQKEQDAQK